MCKCAGVCARLLAGEGSAPSCLGSALSLRLWTSLFSETANCIHSPAYMFVHLGGKQTAQQISILQVLCERERLGQGAARRHANNTVFFLLPINSEEELGVGGLGFLGGMVGLGIFNQTELETNSTDCKHFPPNPSPPLFEPC